MERIRTYRDGDIQDQHVLSQIISKIISMSTQNPKTGHGKEKMRLKRGSERRELSELRESSPNSLQSLKSLPSLSSLKSLKSLSSLKSLLSGNL
jgi:hypothetical protein